MPKLAKEPFTSFDAFHYMLAFILCTLLACLTISLVIHNRLKVKKAYHRINQMAAGSQLTYKKATIADIDVIRSLALEVWPKTYSQILSPQQVIYMLNKTYSKSSLLNQMHAGNQFNIYLFDDKPVGFSSCGEIKPQIFKLNKLYILSDYQKRGIGRFAIQQILKEVTNANATLLVLHVNRHNSARVFYEKLGFSITSREDICIGNGFYMNDYLMELPIKKSFF